MNTQEKLAQARAIVRGVAVGAPGASGPEVELLEAIARVRGLPMHEDVAFVLDIVGTFLKGKGGR